MYVYWRKWEFIHGWLEFSLVSYSEGLCDSFQRQQCIQCELACQKNLKKQSNTQLREDPQMRGFCCCQKVEKAECSSLLALGIWRCCSRSRRRKWGRHGTPVVWAPRPCACTRPAMHLFFGSAHRSQQGWHVLCESAASPSCASFPQVASLPLGHPWEWGADSFWVQSIKRSFVIFFKEQTLEILLFEIYSTKMINYKIQIEAHPRIIHNVKKLKIR